MRAIVLVAAFLALGVASADARWHWGHRHSRSMRSPPDAASLVPRDWELQPPDPNWKGKRYMSPDGAAWIAIYASPAESDAIGAHMKEVAFVDGESITYLRGERDWIAVSGFKGERIFYRLAALACRGKAWHHVAFEYPIAVKRAMDAFVNRAFVAVRASDNDGCETGISSAR